MASDSGYLANTEVYSPELAKQIGLPGSLRALAFYDFGRGFNANAAGSTVPEKVGISSAGFGFRYVASKDFTLRADFVAVVDAGPLGTQVRGDKRAHASMLFGF